MVKHALMKFVRVLAGLFLLFGVDASIRAQESPLEIRPDVLVDVQVLDVESGEPIKEFQVIPGVPFGAAKPGAIAVWQPHLIRRATDGHFEWLKKRSYRDFCLRFEADGFEPQQTKWLKRQNGQTSLTILMDPNEGISGRIMTPNGQPAAGAKLAVSMPNREVRLVAGEISGLGQPPPQKLSDQWRRPRVFKADDQGHFQLESETSYAVVVILHESGMSERPIRDLVVGAEIRLKPWGVIEGKVQWRDKVGPNESIWVTASRDYAYPEMLSMSAQAKTDDDGHFRFDKLPPGRVQLSRVFEFEDGQGSFLFPSRFVDVQHERPTKVTFGGAGHTVTGTVTGLEAFDDLQIAIKPNAPRPDDRAGWRGQALVRASNIGPVFFRDGVSVANDGSFRINGVLPARYQLFISNEDRSVYRVHRLHVPSGLEEGTPIEMGEIAVKRSVKQTLNKPSLDATFFTVQQQTSNEEERNNGQPKAANKVRVVDVSGSAVDAMNGKPIRDFIVQGGFFNPENPGEVTWGFSERRSFGEGRFRTPVRWEQGWTARIVADGYLPTPVITKAPPEGLKKMRVVVRLQPGNLIQGRILDHRKTPVEGARVYAVGPRGIDLELEKPFATRGGQEDRAAVAAFTNKSGEFELAIGEAHAIVVSTKELNAWPIALGEEGAPEQVVLPKPARVVVYYDIGNAETKHEVFLQLLTDRMNGFKGIRTQCRIEVEQEEPYVVKTVTPGSYQIARYRTVGGHGRFFVRMLDRQFFEISPGETKAIRFVRSDGVAISGKVEGAAEAGLGVVLVRVCSIQSQKDGGIEERGEFDALVANEKGEFITEPLEPGSYRLFAEAYPKAINLFGGIDPPSHTGECVVKVPSSGEAPTVTLILKKS